jgi:hypothetical protein
MDRVGTHGTLNNLGWANYGLRADSVFIVLCAVWDPQHVPGRQAAGSKEFAWQPQRRVRRLNRHSGIARITNMMAPQNPGT